VRVYASRRGSFDAVDRAANLLAAAKIPLSLSVAIGEHNCDALRELVRYALALRERHDASVLLSLEPTITPSGPAGNLGHLAAVHAEVIDLCRRERLPISGKFLYAFENLRDGNVASGHFCSVTGSELSVGPTGELVVCHAVEGSEYATLEDLDPSQQIPLPAAVRQRFAGQIRGCAGCEVEGLCGGGCLAQAVCGTGDLAHDPASTFCTLVRTTFRDSVGALLDTAEPALGGGLAQHSTASS